MSIRDRLHDARVLYSNGCSDGALLSVLVAVAATSRRRYPKPDTRWDRDAFIRFLLDENPVLSPMTSWIPVSEADYMRASTPPSGDNQTSTGTKGGMWIRVPGVAQKKEGKLSWPDDLMPLSVILYEFVRNRLAHEAALPSNVAFFDANPGEIVIDNSNGTLRMSNSIMDQLSLAVTYAVENGDLFPEIAAQPLDVVGWNLFSIRRKSQSAYLARRVERFKALTGRDMPQ